MGTGGGKEPSLLFGFGGWRLGGRGPRLGGENESLRLWRVRVLKGKRYWLWTACKVLLSLLLLR